MLKTNEIWHILLVVLILAFVEGFSHQTYDVTVFLIAFLFVAIVVILNIAAKKLTAYYLEADIDTKIWSFQQYYFAAGMKFKKPVPIGLILPLVLSVLSLGAFKWFGVLQYDVEPMKSRVAKRHGFFSYSEMTEFHIGLIGAAGVAVNLLSSVFFYLVGLGDLARISIYFAGFHMIPLGKLDGSKIFFGSLILWAFLAVLCIIFLAYAFLAGSVI